MPTMKTRTETATREMLLLALDLGIRTWTRGFTVGGGALPPRLRTITARMLTLLARNLLIAPWRCLEMGALPAGAGGRVSSRDGEAAGAHAGFGECIGSA
jgi:hypothetical protein